MLKRFTLHCAPHLLAEDEEDEKESPCLHRSKSYGVALTVITQRLNAKMEFKARRFLELRALLNLLQFSIHKLRRS